MNRNDLRHADINLLVVFETMMHERNVTRAGERLFLCQTTISYALGRLRAMFNDPLFIRSGRVMEPTARAEEIHMRLGPALDGIAVALSSTREFDPLTSIETFHVGFCDEVEYVLLPRLMQHLRTAAPNITLVVRRADLWQLPQLLVAGDISLGIGLVQELPASAHCRCLRPVQPMLLRADSVSGLISLDEFCRRPHVTVTAQGQTTDGVDSALAHQGRQLLDGPAGQRLARAAGGFGHAGCGARLCRPGNGSGGRATCRVRTVAPVEPRPVYGLARHQPRRSA
jgi:LysR family transcriptional activator of mexEF-oprN operon